MGVCLVSYKRKITNNNRHKYNTNNTYLIMPIKNPSVNFSVTFPEDLLKALEIARGKMPRATYLQSIAEEKLVKMGVFRSK